RGRVFLVKTPVRALADVQQINAPLTGDSPNQVLKNLVRKSETVRAFLAAELTEGLQSNTLSRRAEAAICLYRCGLADTLKTPLLVNLLKDERGWVRLMAAKALWERQRDKAAIPTLLALLQKPGQEDWIRRRATQVLNQMGPEGQAALKTIQP